MSSWRSFVLCTVVHDSKQGVLSSGMSEARLWEGGVRVIGWVGVICVVVCDCFRWVGGVEGDGRGRVLSCLHVGSVR